MATTEGPAAESFFESRALRRFREVAQSWPATCRNCVVTLATDPYPLVQLQTLPRSAS